MRKRKENSGSYYFADAAVLYKIWKYYLSNNNCVDFCGMSLVCAVPPYKSYLSKQCFAIILQIRQCLSIAGVTFYHPFISFFFFQYNICSSPCMLFQDIFVWSYYWKPDSRYSCVNCDTCFLFAHLKNHWFYYQLTLLTLFKTQVN